MMPKRLLFPAAFALVFLGACAAKESLYGVGYQRGWDRRYRIDLMWTAQLSTDDGLQVEETWKHVVPTDLKYRWRAAGETAEPLITADSVFAGSSRGELRAFDLESGRAIWTVWPGLGPIAGKPGATDKEIVIGTLTGWVAGLKRETGETIWKYQLSSTVGSRIEVIDGRAIVPCVDGSLYAFDPAAGGILWNLPGENPLDGKPFLQGAAGVTPAGPDRAVFGRWDSRLTAVQLSTGKILWTREAAKRSVTSRGVDLYDDDFRLANYQGSSYFTVASRSIGRIRDDDGIVLWQKDLKASNGAALEPSAGIVAAGNQDGELRAYNAEGAEKWVAEKFTFRPCSGMDYFLMVFTWGLDCNQTPAGLFGQPVATQGLFAVPRSDGQVRFYDPATGELVARRATRSNVWGSLGSDAERGIVAAVDNKGTVYVFKVERLGQPVPPLSPPPAP